MIAFYIDSADRSVVVSLLATGLFSGVTTDPAILDEAGLGAADVPDVIGWAMEAGAERVLAQVRGAAAAEMPERGEALCALFDRLVVKVPCSQRGVEAARVLSRGEVLVTAGHDVSQVFPVVISGATFVAPLAARTDAAGCDGLTGSPALLQAFIVTALRLQWLAGSVRTLALILALAAGAVQSIAFGPAVWGHFFDDEATGAAVANFERLASAGAQG